MTFVLLHSPLLLPSATWGALADHLPGRSVVPEVDDDSAPFAERFVARAAAQVAAHVGSDVVTLVAYSGAGPLAPAMVRALADDSVQTDAVVLVDAGLPCPGMSRVDAMAEENPSAATAFGEQLAAGGVYPDWTRSHLTALTSEPATVLAAVRPRGSDFWREPLPDDVLPDDLRCGYVQMSPAYDRSARAARTLGWPVESVELGHFGMLRDPAAVAERVLAVRQAATTTS